VRRVLIEAGRLTFASVVAFGCAIGLESTCPAPTPENSSPGCEGLSLERLVASLTALKGLGPWTAHYLALRLGEPDACPTTDLALRRALPPRPPRAAATLGKIAERWRPWRALAVTRVWVAESSSQPLASAHAARQAM
jgi:3-methyladenine DNA glycosylase/8-oxoguanine DNA glycosylase